MSQKPQHIAVVGATGIVGQALLRLLEARRFPAMRVLPLASARSAGEHITFRGEPLVVETARPEAFEGVDLVFFAATGELSRTLAPEAVRRGAVVIDKSATFRMHADVPLVVPEINAGTATAHSGIIASPNCTTIGLVMALEPLRRVAGLKSLVVTTMQAASGAGAAGLDELTAQTAALALGERVHHETFPAPLAHNVLPLAGTFQADGYSCEEHKLRDESRKILGLPQLQVAMTCVRVPVPVGHSASVLVETEEPISVASARQALQHFPGVRVLDAPQEQVFPTPRLAAETNDVLVGRIRQDVESERLWLFVSSDNLGKGAALNAVQIAEHLNGRPALPRHRAATRVTA